MFVSSKRLHQTWLQFPKRPNGKRSRSGETISPVTLFPFFDQHGATTGVLIVQAAGSGNPARLLAVRMEPGRKQRQIRPRSFRGFRLEEAPRPLDDAAPDWLARSWHFDPWWLLKLPGLDTHPATPALKATNIVPYLPRAIDRFYFSTDLERVKSMRKLASEGASLIQYRADKLSALDWQVPAEPPQTELVAAAGSSVERRSEKGGFRLHPFW